jgi:hypothetical protein
MRPSIVRAACTVAVICLAAACGTTTNSAQQARAGTGAAGFGGAAQGAPGSQPAGPGALGSLSGPSGGAAPGPAAVGIAQSAESFGGTAPGSNDSTAAPPRVTTKPPSSARGVSAATIKIGLEFIKNADQARENMGFSGVTSGNQEQQLKILVDEVNRTGGLAGRKLVPVYHAYDANSSSNASSNEQAACSTFTEDNQVFAVISALNHTEVFFQCLAKVGVPYISAPGLTVSDDEVFRRYPLHLEVNAVSLSKQGDLFGEPLASTGYYDKGAKIGLLTFEQPNFIRAVEGHLKPALKRIGRSVADEVRIAYPQSTSEQGAMAAAIGNAVLRFNQNGITHVLITDVSALVTVLFATAAANQHYYPRYGWLSPNGGQAAADLLSDKRSLEGAVELGWYPSIDLNAANEDMLPANAKRCAQLFASKGYTPQSRNEETVLQIQCEIFFFTQQAANRVQQLTGGAFVNAMRAVSPDVPPNSTYRIDMRGTAAGAHAYRVQRWVTACTCFKADRGMRTLP